MTTLTSETQNSSQVSSGESSSQFIRVTEIWRPDPERGGLVLAEGAYGDLEGFREATINTVFPYGVGLPGLAWQARHPKILKTFDDSVFARTEIAHSVGLTSAVAVPIFTGDHLQAVILFLCGNSNESNGAMEVWCKDPELSYLSLHEGYYGELHKFETLSKSIQFQKGVGLPGEVFEKQRPKLIPDISDDQSAFLRAKYAKEVGITAGVGIPFFGDDENISVLVFLSSRATPIASRFEIWQPLEGNDSLTFIDGIEGGQSTAAPAGPERTINKGEHTIGSAWRFSTALIATDEKADGYSSLLNKAAKRRVLAGCTSGRKLR